MPGSWWPPKPRPDLDDRVIRGKPMKTILKVWAMFGLCLAMVALGACTGGEGEVKTQYATVYGTVTNTMSTTQTQTQTNNIIQTVTNTVTVTK